jgi:hypothetical protein
VIALIDGSTEETINKVALVGLSILIMGLSEQDLGLRDVWRRITRHTYINEMKFLPV